jgi:Spy/CpxP family protein refolding chaperone
MRTLCAVLTLAAAMTVCVTLDAAPAKDDPGQNEGYVVVESVGELSLTDDQEKKIEDIRKECQPKVMEAAKQLTGMVKEEVDKVRAVLTPEQKEKLQAFKEEHKEHRFEGLAARLAHLRELHLTDAEREQVAEIRKEFRPRITKAMEGLMGILTDDQKRAREEALKAGKSRREIRAALNLTDEQKEKVEAVCKDVTAVVREEMEKIGDVLTASQKEKLEELREEHKERVRDRMAHRIANFKELNLTDEQKTAIADIRKEYRPKIHEAGNNLRATIREEVGMIVGVLKG